MGRERAGQGEPNTDRATHLLMPWPLRRARKETGEIQWKTQRPRDREEETERWEIDKMQRHGSLGMESLRM